MFKKLKEFFFGAAQVATPAAPYKVEAPAATIAKAPVITAAKPVVNTVKKSVPKKPSAGTRGRKPKAKPAVK